MFARKLERVVSLLSRLPGVGEKTAQRYLLFLVTADESLSRELGAELAQLHDVLRPCVRCGNIAEVDADDGPPIPGVPHSTRSTREQPVCAVCLDNKRDAHLLCVVARVHDLLAIERAGTMRGRYFVLGKLLSPLEGVGPESLPIAHLVDRIREEGVTEVIVATPPSVDGEATALLLKRELAPLGVALSRIASGVPHGGDLEFADPITMGRALSGRQRL
jgi:recombination protein RecR